MSQSRSVVAVLAFVVLLAATSQAGGQSNVALVDVVKRTVLVDKIMWMAHFFTKTTEPQSPAEVAGNIPKFAGQPGTTPTEQTWHSDVRRFQEPLAKVFLGLTGLPEKYFLRMPTYVPVIFGKREEDLVLLITGLTDGKIYNTLQLDARARAAKAVSEVLAPAWKAFQALPTAPDIKFVGFAATYGTQDFLDKASPMSLKAESVVVVVPLDRALKFASGALTEDELIEASDVWVSDKDTVSDVKKIKLTLR